MRNCFLACAGIVTFSALAHAASLAPKEIQATFFTGQPFTASSPKGVKYKMVFTADGKITREPDGRAGTKDGARGNLPRTVSAPPGKVASPTATP
jgi:hypothetical protein